MRVSVGMKVLVGVCWEAATSIQIKFLNLNIKQI